MFVSLTHKNDFNFVAEDDKGVQISMQGSAQDGNPKSALSPMQLVLAAVGGCTGMDVVGILHKQKQLYSEFVVEVHGERSEEIPKVFTRIVIAFKFDGDIDPAKAWRAASLSAEKYCSVSHMLQASVDIVHEVYVNGVKHEA